MGQAVQSLRGRFQEIELGFGDINLDEAEENFLSLNRYESLSPSLLDELDDKGIFFPSSMPAARTDLHLERPDMLTWGFPYHCPEPHHQQEPPCRACSPAAVCELTADGQSFNRVPRPVEDYSFQDTHRDILAKMQAAQEISGYAVTIDPNQNVLVDDTLRISYVLVPVGVAVKIYVEEGLSLTANKT